MKIKTILAFVFVGYMLTQHCFAQTDSAKVIAIRLYAAHIDSLIENEDRNIRRSIEEGSVSKETVLTEESDKGIIRSRTVVDKGGMSIETYFNVRSDTIYKALYHDTIDKNYYETYYYCNNKLVAANVMVKDDAGNFPVLQGREEYYANSTVTIRSGTGFISNYNNTRLSLSLHDRGNEYLKKELAIKKH